MASFALPTPGAGPARAPGHLAQAEPGLQTQARASAQEPTARAQSPCHLRPDGMDVYCTRAASLDAFVTSSLQPPAEFVGTTRRALGTLGTALRECGSRPGPGAPAPSWRVLKIAKVGSQGAGATSGSPLVSGGTPRRTRAH